MRAIARRWKTLMARSDGARLERCLREHDHELLAAVAAHDVLGPRAVAQLAAERSKNRVPAVVTVAEVIDVDREDS